MKKIISQMGVATVVVGLLCFALTAQAAKQNQKKKGTEKGGGSSGEIVFRGSVTHIDPASFTMTMHGADVVLGETSGATPKKASGKNQKLTATAPPATSGAPQDRQFFINAACKITNGQSTAMVSDLKPGTGVDVSYSEGPVGHYSATTIAITGATPAATPAQPPKGKKKNKP